MLTSFGGQGVPGRHDLALRVSGCRGLLARYFAVWKCVITVHGHIRVMKLQECLGIRPPFPVRLGLRRGNRLNYCRAEADVDRTGTNRSAQDIAWQERGCQELIIHSVGSALRALGVVSLSVVGVFE